jgi:hypothetical protein
MKAPINISNITDDNFDTDEDHAECWFRNMKRLNADMIEKDKLYNIRLKNNTINLGVYKLIDFTGLTTLQSTLDGRIFNMPTYYTVASTLTNSTNISVCMMNQEETYYIKLKPPMGNYTLIDSVKLINYDFNIIMKKYNMNDELITFNVNDIYAYTNVSH